MGAPPEPFHVDPARAEAFAVVDTGFYVRAEHNGRWVNADIAVLTLPSLRQFLDDPRWRGKAAERVLLSVLGFSYKDAWGEERQGPVSVRPDAG